MKSITNREADAWIAGMSPEDIRQIIKEYHVLRHTVCARILGVATGADDWIDRAIATATRIKECETELRRIINTVENACIEARKNARGTVCTNCMGNGMVRENSCSMCRGSGVRSFV